MATPKYNTYVGMRYVPIFDGEWDRTKTYEPLTIVSYQGNSYTSRTFVPTGVDVTNETYWALTGNYNAQVEYYRQETARVAESLDECIKTYDTVNDLINDSDISEDIVCKTLGYYSVNDGGGAFYKIMSTAPSGKYETLQNSLYAKLIDNNIINVKQYGAKGDGVQDDTTIIQGCIDSNSFKTIFFPDGIYKVSSPIVTSGTPSDGVELLLSRYAVIKADDNNWTDGDYVIELGGIDSAYDAEALGATTGISGGMIDCSSVANGIVNNGGRQFYIKNIDIKYVKTIGIGILKGNNSADADISYVNMQGIEAPNSKGLYVIANDNTISHMRINGFRTGAHFESNGNLVDGIHPLYTDSTYSSYSDTIGFFVKGYNNFFSECYSDGFSTAFYLADYYPNHFANCFAYWYSATMNPQTAIFSPGNMRSNFTNLVVGFYDGTTNNAVFLSDTNTSDGKIVDLFISNEANLNNPNDKSKRVVLNKRYSSLILNDLTIPSIYSAQEISYERNGRVVVVKLKFTLTNALTSSDNTTLVGNLPNCSDTRFITLHANNGTPYRVRFGGNTINNAFVAIPAGTEIYGEFTYIANDAITV